MSDLSESDLVLLRQADRAIFASLGRGVVIDSTDPAGSCPAAWIKLRKDGSYDIEVLHHRDAAKRISELSPKQAARLRGLDGRVFVMATKGHAKAQKAAAKATKAGGQ